MASLKSEGIKSNDLGVYIAVRPFTEWGKAIFSGLSPELRETMVHLGICHYLVIFQTPSGDFIQFDFGPKGGDITLSGGLFSRFGRKEGVNDKKRGVAGEVRESVLKELPSRSLHLGRTSLSLSDVRSFNLSHNLYYKLYENDCRHYANSLIRYTTGSENCTAELIRNLYTAHARIDPITARSSSNAQQSSASGNGHIAVGQENSNLLPAAPSTSARPLRHGAGVGDMSTCPLPPAPKPSPWLLERMVCVGQYVTDVANWGVVSSVIRLGEASLAGLVLSKTTARLQVPRLTALRNPFNFGTKLGPERLKIPVTSLTLNTPAGPSSTPAAVGVRGLGGVSRLTASTARHLTTYVRNPLFAMVHAAARRVTPVGPAPLDPHTPFRNPLFALARAAARCVTPTGPYPQPPMRPRFLTPGERSWLFRPSSWTYMWGNLRGIMGAPLRRRTVQIPVAVTSVAAAARSSSKNNRNIGGSRLRWGRTTFSKAPVAMLGVKDLAGAASSGSAVTALATATMVAPGTPREAAHASGSSRHTEHAPSLASQSLAFTFQPASSSFLTPPEPCLTYVHTSMTSELAGGAGSLALEAGCSSSLCEPNMPVGPDGMQYGDRMQLIDLGNSELADWGIFSTRLSKSQSTPAFSDLLRQQQGAPAVGVNGQDPPSQHHALAVAYTQKMPHNASNTPSKTSLTTDSISHSADSFHAASSSSHSDSSGVLPSSNSTQSAAIATPPRTPTPRLRFRFPVWGAAPSNRQAMSHTGAQPRGLFQGGLAPLSQGLQSSSRRLGDLARYITYEIKRLPLVAQ